MSAKKESVRKTPVGSPAAAPKGAVAKGKTTGPPSAKSPTAAPATSGAAIKPSTDKAATTPQKTDKPSREWPVPKVFGLRREFKHTDGYIACAAISYDRKILACGHKDGLVTFWDISAEKITKKTEVKAAHKGMVTCLAETWGRFASAGEDGKVVIYSQTYTVAFSMAEHKAPITALHWGPCEAYPIVSGDEKGILYCTDANTGKKTIELTGHPFGPIHKISGSQSHFVVADKKNFVGIFDFDGSIGNFHDICPENGPINIDGLWALENDSMFLTGFTDGTIQMDSLHNGGYLGEISDGLVRNPGASNRHDCLRPSRHNKFVYSSSPESVRQHTLELTGSVIVRAVPSHPHPTVRIRWLALTACGLFFGASGDLGMFIDLQSPITNAERIFVTAHRLELAEVEVSHLRAELQCLIEQQVGEAVYGADVWNQSGGAALSGSGKGSSASPTGLAAAGGKKSARSPAPANAAKKK